MGLAQVERELMGRLLDHLPEGYQEGDVRLPNAPYDIPNNKKSLRTTVVISETNNITVTGSVCRTRGYFYVDVFIPGDRGSQEALQDGEHIQSLFHNQSTEHACILEATLKPIGIEAQTGLYHVQIQTRFFYEE